MTDKPDLVERVSRTLIDAIRISETEDETRPLNHVTHSISNIGYVDGWFKLDPVARAAVTETLEVMMEWVDQHDHDPCAEMTAFHAIKYFAAENNIKLNKE